MEEISTTEIDSLLEDVLLKRAEYDKAKETSSKFYEAKKAAEAKVMEALTKCGKTKWSIDGIGTASIVNQLSVQVPKTNADKQKLWNYIVSKYGEAVAFDKFSMHSKTLISFYNEEIKAAEDASLFQLPGVEEPTYQQEFRFRGA